MTAESTGTVVVKRHLEASPERVFDAWLNPALARKFFFATPTGQVIRADIDSRVGGAFNVTDRRGADDVEHVGSYLEIDRPRRLAFTFAVPMYSKVFTRVAIDLAPKENGCDLTLTHEGVLAEYLERTPKGWNMILDRLSAALAD